MGRKGSNSSPKEIDLVEVFDLLSEALYVLKQLPPRTTTRSIHEDWCGPLEDRIERFLASPWRNPNPTSPTGSKAKA